jgi:hypothetical protein
LSKNENDSVQTDHAKVHGRNGSSHGRNILHIKASSVASHIRELWRDIQAILRYPLLIVAFAVDAVIVLPTSIIVGGLVYGLFGCIIFATISQIPIEILVYRKIKEEARAVKLMSEGWESKKTTEELMKEYKKLLEKKK